MTVEVSQELTLEIRKESEGMGKKGEEKKDKQRPLHLAKNIILHT